MEIKLNLETGLIEILEEYRSEKINNIKHRQEKLYRDLVQELTECDYSILIRRMIIDKGVDMKLDRHNSGIF